MHLEVKISLIKRSWQVPTALSFFFSSPLLFWFVSTRLCICKNGSGCWLIFFCPRLMSCCSLPCNENYCSWKSCIENFNNQPALDKLLLANIQGAWTWSCHGNLWGPHPCEENVFLKCIGWHIIARECGLLVKTVVCCFLRSYKVEAETIRNLVT